MDLFLNIEFHDIRSFVMNPLSNEKIEDNSKLKQYADDTYIVNHNVKFVNHRVEKNVGKHSGKRRKCCHQHFLLFPLCLQNQLSHSRSHNSLLHNPDF